MPAIREHDVTPPSLDDDDGMPPLVDNPNPSMTFTFFTDMTPITALSTDPTLPFETVWENPVPLPAEPASPPVDTAELYEPGACHAQERASHGRKRDASYIPRPPNAFILFRSSFIRSQQVPEKVEGNHSTLSKIIGKYWKTLSREEREVWEAKALVAQAEHRKRYPDWRFRPGSNAFAKLKVKDGPHPANRKRANQAGRKVKGDPANKKAKSGDERCAIIADLLVEGKTGVDLEDAVRRWEDSAGRANEKRHGVCNDMIKTGASKEGEGEWHKMASPIDIHGALVSASSDEPFSAPSGGAGAIQVDICGYTLTQPRAQTPDGTHDDRFRIPLTAMFKRSLSAPAAQYSPNHISHQGHDSLNSVFANVSYDIDTSQGICVPTFGGGHVEDLARVVSADTIGSLSPLVLPSVLQEGVSARWNDPYNLLETSLGIPSSPDCPALTYALQSPVSSSVSPVEDPSLAYTFCATNTGGGFGAGLAPSAAYEPKSWTECALGVHAQMPIFVNSYDWSAFPDAYGADVAYDYCTGTGAVGCNLLGTGDHYIRLRAHAGECLPAVAY